MVGVFTGLEVGFQRGSVAQLGGVGLLGSATHGKGGESVSVNASNGNLVISRQDEFLTGLGPDASFSRTYNSHHTWNQGDNSWRESFDRRVFDHVVGVSVKRVSADGSIVTYEYENGKYIGEDGAGAHDVLSYTTDPNDSNRIIWTWDKDGKGQHKEIYERYGQTEGTLNWQLMSVEDADANRLELTWWADFRLSKVENQNGEYVQYAWGGVGNHELHEVRTFLRGENGAAQNAWKQFTRTYYEYDAQGRIERVVTDLSPNDNMLEASPPNSSDADHPSNGMSYATTFTYDGSSNRITAIDQTDGSRLDIEYNYDSVSQTYRVSSTTQKVDDTRSRKTWYAYEVGKTTITTGDSTNTLADSGNTETIVKYDSQGQLSEVIEPPAEANADQRVTKFTYDSEGNVTSVGNYVRVGNVDTFVSGSTHIFDERGNNIASVNEQGVRTVRSFSDKNQLLSETRLSQNLLINPDADNGASLSGSLPTGWTQWSNDTDGGHSFGVNAIVGQNWFLDGDDGTFVISQQDNQQGYVYQISSLFDVVPGEDYIASVYAGAHRADGDVFLWFTGDGGETSAGIQVQTSRIYANEKIGGDQITDFKRIWSSATAPDWATKGYLVVRKHATKTTQNPSWLTSYLFTTRPQVELVTEGQTVPSEYFGNTEQFDAETTRYVYDDEGHLRFTISAEGYVTGYEYSADGALQNSFMYPDQIYTVDGQSTAAEMQSWVDALSTNGLLAHREQIEYQYDPRGNQSAIIKRSGATADGGNTLTGSYSSQHHVYDQSGNLLERYYMGQQKETFVYDGLGRLVETTGLSGASTTIQFDDENTTTLVTSEDDYITTSVFNKAGDLLSTSSNQSTNVTTNTAASSYLYDDFGRLRVSSDRTGVELYYLYDGAGRLTAEVQESGRVKEFRYNSMGQEVVTINYNFKVTQQDLILLRAGDPNLSMNGIRPDAHGRDIWSWTVYDDTGRVTGNVDGIGRVTRYSYDIAGRVAATFEYDQLLNVGSFKVPNSLGPSFVDLEAGHKLADAEQINRQFYDRDGRSIGGLNAEGYLTEIAYDGAGRKIRDTVYANKISGPLEGNESFVELLASVVKDANKDLTSRYVYDNQGLLRFTVDALDYVTETLYNETIDENAVGLVRRTIAYSETLSAPIDYSYTSLKSAVASLSQSDAQETYFIYNDRAQLRFIVNAEGEVTEKRYDIEGQNTISISYGGFFDVATLSSNEAQHLNNLVAWGNGETNRRVSYNYFNNKGDLIYVRDGENYITEYVYDVEGRLKTTYRFNSRYDSSAYATVEAFATAMDNSESNYVKTRQTHNGDGIVQDNYDGTGTRFFQMRHGNGLLGWEIEAFGQGNDESRRSLYLHDAAGRLIQTNEYDGDAWSWSNPNRKTYYSYDGFGNLSTTSDYNGNVTTFTHDKLGRVITETNAENDTAIFEYDAFGNVVKKIDERGNSTYSYFDRLGRKTLEIDAERFISSWVYDAFGNLESESRYHDPVSANQTLTTDVPPSFNVNGPKSKTSYTYNELGQLLTVTDAEGGNTNYTYNDYGELETMTNALGGVTNYTYDKLGKLETETLQIDTHSADPNSAQYTFVTNRFVYDSRGNMTLKIEAEGLDEARTTEFVYDKADRLIKTIGEMQDVYSATSAASSTRPEAAITYDRRGNVVERKDANGARTLFYYNDYDQLTHEVSSSGTLTRHFYEDENGDYHSNVTRTRIYATQLAVLPTGEFWQTSPPSIAESVDDRVTSFQYDGLNRMVLSRVVGVDITANINGKAAFLSNQDLETTYTYDAMGNVKTVTDPNGGITYSYYDALGRKTYQIDQSGYVTSWEYNALGNVTKETRFDTPVTNPSEEVEPTIVSNTNDRVTEYEYDELGRRLKETRLGVEYFDATATNNVSVAGSEIQYEYNALGLVTKKTEASGDVRIYTYDQAGQLQSEKRTEYAAQFLGASFDVAPEVRYVYNAHGDLIQTTSVGTSGLSDDRHTHYEFDVAGRLALTKEENAHRIDTNTAEADVDRYYLYDAMGRIVREEYRRTEHDHTAQAPKIFYEAIGYEYDDAGRVIKQGLMAKSGETYVWKEGAATTEYGVFGEVVSTGFDGVNAQQNNYDNAGRLWRSNAGDGVWKYFFYDANGNQRVVLSSVGGELANKSQAYIVNLYDTQTGDIFIGENFVNGVTATITNFDARGLAIEVRETERELASGSARQDLSTQRSYNAFGEVSAETDARGASVSYTYNKMGRLISTISDVVDVTSESGVTNSQALTDKMFYDISGRLVATEDAKGNRTEFELLSGTGYDGSDALRTHIKFADNGEIITHYDSHGDARTIIDQLNRVTTQFFDRGGRLVEIRRPSTEVNGSTTANFIKHEYFRYDETGNQIRSWDNAILNQLGNQPLYALTRYDHQGRVTEHTTKGGATTNYQYAWVSGISTALGNFGGWETTKTEANGKTLTTRADVFGRQTFKDDLGNRIFTYTYDLGGRLISDSMGTGYTYLNSGQIEKSTQGALSTSYGYDEVGNVVSELLKNGGVTVSDQTATYDVLGRMTNWTAAETATLPQASMAFKYDANGNIVNQSSTFFDLNDDGTKGAADTRDYWYQFDSLNRVTRQKGGLSNGAQSGGTSFEYDKAGQRVHSIENGAKEFYEYSAAGQLVRVRDGEMQALQSGNRAGDYGIRAEFEYDESGRQISQIDYVVSESDIQDLGGVPWTSELIETRVFEKQTTYTVDGRAFSETSFTLQDGASAVKVSLQDFFYGTVSDNQNPNYFIPSDLDLRNGNAALGSQTLVNTHSFENEANYDAFVAALAAGTTATADTTNQLHYQYDFTDGARQLKIRFLDAQNQPYDQSQFTYNAFDHLTKIDINDGRVRDVVYTTDTSGQIIKRREADTVGGNGGDPSEIWYRFGGREMGYISNNGTRETNYAQSIANRRAVPGANDNGAFWNRSETGSSYADFDQSVASINSYSQGSGAGSYTARAGETLSSVAASLWGDASLWYKLADANGLTGQVSLSEGQRLRIPAGVLKNTHNASTFSPYNPGEAIGDVNPTTPQPPKDGNKCGTVGQVVLVAIAVAVAAVVTGGLAGGISASLNGGAGAFWGGAKAGIGALAGGGGVGGSILAGGMVGSGTASVAAAASIGAMGGVALSGGATALAIGASAIGGAAGSIASQGVGVATGIQAKFSWNAVAQAAIGGGLGSAGKLGVGGSEWASNAARAGVRNILGQGIGLATGLQSKFDWAGVAGAAVGSAGSAPFGNQYVASAASAIANAATRSAIDGSSFGDNLRAAIPDVIGQALGNAVAGGVTAALQARSGASVQDTRTSRAELEQFASGLRPQDDSSAKFILTQESGGIVLDILRGGTGADPRGSGISMVPDDIGDIQRNAIAEDDAAAIEEMRIALDGLNDTMDMLAAPIGLSAGVLAGATFDAIYGAYSVGDFVFRDFTGAVGYNVFGIEAFEQSSLDYFNAVDTATGYLFDPRSLWNDVSTAVSAEMSLSAQAWANGNYFDAGFNFTPGKLALGIAAPAAFGRLTGVTGANSSSTIFSVDEINLRVGSYSALPDSYIYLDVAVDMRNAPASSRLTGEGFPRNGPWFWRQLRDSNPEYFDVNNTLAVNRGLAPIVNDTWTEHFPNHAGFRGSVLVHHHFEQGPLATPIPEPVHLRYNKQLHPITYPNE